VALNGIFSIKDDALHRILWGADMDDKILGGLAGIVTLFVVGAVFGRVAGTDKGGAPMVGDRVMSGLIAIPLISVAVHYLLPNAHIGWAIAAPSPLLAYVLLLAGTRGNVSNNSWQTISNTKFVPALLIAVGALYLAAATIVLANSLHK
jgi:hypothetical protein